MNQYSCHVLSVTHIVILCQVYYNQINLKYDAWILYLHGGQSVYNISTVYLCIFKCYAFTNIALQILHTTLCITKFWCSNRFFHALYKIGEFLLFIHVHQLSSRIMVIFNDVSLNSLYEQKNRIHQPPMDQQLNTTSDSCIHPSAGTRRARWWLCAFFGYNTCLS